LLGQRGIYRTERNLKFVPRDAETGEPKLMGQLQVIHALTNSYGEDDKPIWSMKFLNLRKEKFYPKWKNFKTYW